MLPVVRWNCKPPTRSSNEGCARTATWRGSTSHLPLQAAYAIVQWYGRFVPLKTCTSRMPLPIRASHGAIRVICDHQVELSVGTVPICVICVRPLP